MSLVLNRSRQVPADETPAFGGIAERFRRAGDLERAVALCQDGLRKFPDHLSARVTLGWALLDLGKYDEAQNELEQVLKRAPDNLAAIRGLAELHERAENAVVVPTEEAEEQERAEIAQAVESARLFEAEAASHAAIQAELVSPPAEMPKRTKGHASHAAPPVPPPVEPAAQDPIVAAAPRIDAVVAPEHVEPAAGAAREPAVLVPSFEDLSAEFGGPAVGPPDPVTAVVDASVDEMPTVVEPFCVDEPPPVRDLMALDFAEPPGADADALTSAAALLATLELEAEFTLPPPEQLVDAATHTAMLAADVQARAPEWHPEPDVAELLAQLAQEDELEAVAPVMVAVDHMAGAVVHPEPDVADFAAQLEHAHDQLAEPAPPVFASDHFPAAVEFHPEPTVHDVASEPAASTGAMSDMVDHTATWGADSRDFMAAMESPTFVEPAGAIEHPAFAEPVAAMEGVEFAEPLVNEPIVAEPIAAETPVLADEPVNLSSGPAFSLTSPVLADLEASTNQSPIFAEDAELAEMAYEGPRFDFDVEPPEAVFGTVMAATASRSLQSVAALEKMLTRISARRLELASEYSAS